MSRDFTWRDAGRTVLLRRDGMSQAAVLLREHGVERFQLISTERALVGAPKLVAAAERVHHVAPGQVPDVAAALLDALEPPAPEALGPAQPVGEDGVLPLPFVALGGGRAIDVAKALAAVSGAAVAAIPTTMSGAEMTAIHRLPAGAEGRALRMVRPSLVIADPELMTSAPEDELRASSMNALAHGADTLYLPLSNPVSELCALRGAEAICLALGQGRETRDRALLALGSLLCGYAIDSAGAGLHHLVCQTLVRVCGTPHAGTNAAILPHAVAFLADRARQPFAGLASALGVPIEELPGRIAELGRPRRLAELGGDPSRLDEAIDAMLRRSELADVPGPPTRDDLAGLVGAAW